MLNEIALRNLYSGHTGKEGGKRFNFFLPFILKILILFEY